MPQFHHSEGFGWLDAFTLVVLIAAVGLLIRSHWPTESSPVAVESGNEDVAIELAAETVAKLIAGDVNIIGDPTAKGRIVVFSDFECGYCRRLVHVLDTALTGLSREVAVVHRNLPLQNHAFARSAAIAAECAADQGQFEEMYRLMFDRQEQIASQPWIDFAREAGVGDLDRFRTCMLSDEPARAVDMDLALAGELQLPGTPALVVGSKLLLGLPTSDQVARLLIEQ